jgi:hypothetical protein
MNRHEALLLALLAVEPSLALFYSKTELLAHALTLLHRLKICAHIEATEEGSRE